MKSRIALLLILIVFMVSSCSKEQDSKSYVSKNDVTSVIEALAAEKEEASSKVQLDVPTVKVPASNVGEIDVDLTTMSSSVVYSAVYDMITNPGSYIGKVVKMTGPIAMYHDPSSDKRYFACIIRDATACCAQGMEFVLNSSYSYPEDYPELGTEVTVVGTFDTYNESQYQYCTLKNAQLL